MKIFTKIINNCKQCPNLKGNHPVYYCDIINKYVFDRDKIHDNCPLEDYTN